MKIQGPQFKHIQAYKQQSDRKTAQHAKNERKDELNISTKAKRLQEADKATQKRASYLKQIKHEIETGKYQVNYEKTAEKIIDFWSKY